MPKILSVARCACVFAMHTRKYSVWQKGYNESDWKSEKKEDKEGTL